MKQLADLLAQLAPEEKAALLEGTHSWSTNAVPRLGIPSLFLTDGPHGLRKVRHPGAGFDLADNAHASAFPTSAAVASSWDTGNAYRAGRAIAAECLAAGTDVLLAPGVNIKRSPLCGRNFEYYSEDPLLSGAFGSAFVRGVQSLGVGCCVKHFAANSCEGNRFEGDSEVDERALREIYLRAFEKTVKEARPYAVMCAYNRVNGTFASQNRRLLTDVLRGEWGFDGPVISDWGATCDRVRGVLAGCDLDMPGGVTHNRASILAAVKSGMLPMPALNRAAGRMLGLIEACGAARRGSAYTQEEHAALACEVAEDCAVLLKNDGTLPLNGTEKLLAVGEFFEKMRYQGAGSSLVNPPHVTAPRDAFARRGIRFRYEKGFRCFSRERDPALERAALAAAERADTVLFFGGLTDFDESEGFDRAGMELPENQTALLEALTSAGKKVVLVLFAGAPVELPQFGRLSALLDMMLPGMEGGEAAAALLFGEASPSGKLAESWPLRAEDSSCAADFGRSPVALYYESIYVGYRFYDKAKTRLRFPFGYGLSYTSFAYRNLSVRREGGNVLVAAEIANTGARDGAEAVQLYVKNPSGGVFKAEKELRAFTKVFLRAGESKTVTLRFSVTDLAYWNIRRGWVVENGGYEILVGASCADIRLKAPLAVTGEPEESSPFPAAVEAAYAAPPKSVPACFAQLLGRPVPKAPPALPLTMESPLEEFRRTPVGLALYLFAMHAARKDYRRAQKLPDSPERDLRLKNTYFIARQLPYNSGRSLCMSSGGQLPYHTAEGLVELANGRLLRGARALLQKETVPPLPADTQTAPPPEEPARAAAGRNA